MPCAGVLAWDLTFTGPITFWSAVSGPTHVNELIFACLDAGLVLLPLERGSDHDNWHQLSLDDK